jgi:hypothetical protein
LTPTPGSSIGELEALSPLTFRAAYPMGAVELRTARNVVLGGGRLVVGLGVKPTWVAVREGKMVVSLERSLEVEVDPPPAVPCGDLTVAGRDARYGSPQRQRPAGARFVHLGTDAIALHSAPESADAWSLRYAGPFELVEETPGWIRVRAAWKDGSHIEGWTPARQVHAGLAWPSVSVDGGATRGGCQVVDQPASTRVQVHARAPVAVTPDGEVWARFSASRWVDAQASPATRGWFAITRLPGVTFEGCEPVAWVRAADLSGGPGGVP